MLAAVFMDCATHQKLESRPVAEDLGSPANVQTPLGKHDGFVVGACEMGTSTFFFVQGSGARRLLSDDPEKWSEGGKVRLRAISAPQPWVIGTAFGKGCGGGVAISYVDNWRDMDSVLQKVGPNLSRYSDVVTFVVQARWTEQKPDSAEADSAAGIQH
jgi:hypothetical protein